MTAFFGNCSSFSGVQKVSGHEALDRTEQCCGVSLPTLRERGSAYEQLWTPDRLQAGYCELAHNYCRLGAIAEELAGFFDVTRGTINNWIASIPEFAAALREGRDLADARVARGLFARAMGYSHKVDRTVLHRGEERTISNMVCYPSDTQACIFWLRNRRRQTWCEKASTRAGGRVGFRRCARCRRRERAQCW
jgi:hypothetical protein